MTEFAGIIFYNVIPAKTNQSSFVQIMTMQSLGFILSSMMIHLKPTTTSYYTTSCLLNLFFQFLLVTTTLDVQLRFEAM